MLNLSSLAVGMSFEAEVGVSRSSSSPIKILQQPNAKEFGCLLHMMFQGVGATKLLFELDQVFMSD